MKKFLIIFLILFIPSQVIYAEDNEWSIGSIIYDRYINIKTYNDLSNNSIWKQDNEYNTLLLQTLNSTEPIEIIRIEKE